MSAQRPAADEWRSAWCAALDALEMDVVAVEEMLSDDRRTREIPVADPWSPPEGLGPLPLDLRPRADAILARQIAVAQAMTLIMAGNRRQAAMIARVESGSNGAPRPVYINCAA
ncbi:hypothetical protein Ppa06_69740 [Planomonospora parontospora subsp. parontospora]|uniref:Uncharacterized protein n=2 Tax=Planomonospora parontospora TaxID=58119 RepID=A0AA37BP93_9ACTN|nr:hypothetical protein [Planomonospora parontospora]GGL01042.1 hypothetical protein GCM10010126_70380 [Planomonospora parontospora]GII13176.1 hypothetical protein Ppa06_69740 [Planomonospora parontospora subsp. parontospora]